MQSFLKSKLKIISIIFLLLFFAIVGILFLPVIEVIIPEYLPPSKEIKLFLFPEKADYKISQGNQLIGIRSMENGTISTISLSVFDEQRELNSICSEAETKMRDMYKGDANPPVLSYERVQLRNGTDTCILSLADEKGTLRLIVFNLDDKTIFFTNMGEHPFEKEEDEKIISSLKKTRISLFQLLRYNNFGR